MTFKKDLSIEFAGVKCLNPFFLASSPVCNNYDMIAKAFEDGWAGVFYKNQDSVPEHEISPIFGVRDMGGPWSMFKTANTLHRTHSNRTLNSCTDSRETIRNTGSSQLSWAEVTKTGSTW